MRIKKYTEDQVKRAIETSTTYRQVLEKIGVVPSGGNYTCIKKIIHKYGLDISHFTLKGSNKGKKFGPKRPVADYLNNIQSILSFKLKKRLLEEGIFQYECSSCFLSMWLDGKIPLELDHIDGNSNNNSLSNLRLLCPNCHALTSTYRGKNRKKLVPLVGFEPTL